jgi:hypothetical protein
MAKGISVTLRGRKHTSLVVPPLAALLLALAGCGGDGSNASSTTRADTVTRTVTTPATKQAATATSTTTTTPPPNPNASLSLRAAEQVLDAHGYATLTERDWRPDQPLKVLIGIERGGGAQSELAFLFVGDRWIGTDTKDPSGQLEVAQQSGDAVTIVYHLYKPGDAVEDPTGGTAQVTYRWDGTTLVPQGAIPSASPDAPLGRR